MNCAIIGSTKIAEVHAEQLIKSGVKEITFISRSIKKRKKIISNIRKKVSKRILFTHSNLKILKKNTYKFVCICSKTEVHDKHLMEVLKLKSIIIVEKPIISLLKFKNKYINFLTKIYKKNKKIVVCYPYLFLAKSFKKFSSPIQKINKINFEFQTGGNATFKKICINLMPHALSFFHIFLNKEFLKKKIIINNSQVKKSLWQTSFKTGEIIINLIFKENYQKKTSLKLTINNLLLIRKTKKNKGKFINFIHNYKTKKNRIIKNPMAEFYKDLTRNTNNQKYFRNNRNITFDIMKKNNFFLN
tara:strand:- start:368 stop:1273 length:906 start_codon:yes stop_codon:yes gene_type:complete